MKRLTAALGLVPFAAYVLLFLLVPTLLAILSGFQDSKGRFTLANFAAFKDTAIWDAFWASTWLSLVTAVAGAVIGALACWALTGVNPDGWVRRCMDSAASVLAQFGGVMLAFAFIVTIGMNAFITVFLKDKLGIDLYSGGNWLYTVPGLILPYLYFQIPLMIITFLPAMEGLKPQWAEASATLGGTRASYWTKVGFPVLAPSFLGALLLLFANAFSSYATAAALISQGAQIVPLQIRAALVGETGASSANTAGVLALGMVVVMTVVMVIYSVLMKRAARWQR
ncbi:ABC transporter permease subunit [Galactobacter valiniphilus]|uniref:ABC transporter permease subunit n=1 Tax=Galactobacter valiniphilus TaxID=2676122 RepID=A0A399J769_9MICC|nr:ABC transporter permease subunit [Galactobacter valiniphilus]RII41144.1 ABC transporter permease subunit [Galactobacter valiniphilus]